jgi:hypothetical protein
MLRLRLPLDISPLFGRTSFTCQQCFMLIAQLLKRFPFPDLELKANYSHSSLR